MSKPKCAVNVVFRCKPEHANAFQLAAQQQAKNSLDKEAWCHQFDVCLNPDDPTIVLLYETYDDRAAFEKHRQTDHLAEFNATIKDWVVSREVTIWDIAG